MHQELSSGLVQSDLTIQYGHNENGVTAGFKKKDAQVFVGEIIATFLLCFLIAATKVNIGNGSTIVAIGLGLVSIIYTFAPISGAQLNPSVTLGLYLRGKMNLFEAVYSIIAECIGGLLAGLSVCALYGGDWGAVGYPDIADTNRRVAAFWTEVICVFFLLTGVFNSATTKIQRNNSYYGIAFGFIVLSNALVAAPISGACFNPAVAMLALLHGKYANMWVYTAGPLTGSFLAWAFFHVTSPEDAMGKTKSAESKPISIDALLTRMSVRMSLPPISDGNMTRMISMLAMEFVGTFMIAWVLALSINAAPSDQSIAIGTAVCSMVYIGGAVSGGHYNPCVTLGVYLRGKLEKPQSMRALDAFLYCFVQVLGASLGGTAAAYANNGYENLLIPSVNTDDHTYFAAVAAEIIVSAFLVLTVLSAGTSEKVAGNSYFGLAIGFVVLGGVVAVGDIVPGSTFNPAVGMVLPVIADRHADDIWVCLVGDTIGAFIAVALYAFWRDVLKKPEAIDRGQSKYFRDDEESNNYNIKSPLLQ